MQHCGHHPRLYLFPAAGDIPRMARRDRRSRVDRSQETVPVAACVTGSVGHHLHQFHLRAGVGAMATYGLGGRDHHRARSRQRQRQERRRLDGDDTRLVQLRPSHHRHDRLARYDIELADDGEVNG